MRTVTKGVRWLGMLCILASFAGTAYAQRTVTLTLNTATLPDTTNTNSLIEVRGAVGEVAPFTLPDDNIIDWNADSTLEPENLGGDYWRVVFQIPDDQALAFKFFSDQAETSAGIGGWEDGDNHALEAGQGDVDLGLHYFVKGDGQPYDWQPFEEKQDSVAVHFRVYMNTEEAVGAGIGYDRDADGQIIGVRGDVLDINGDQSVTGPLDWGSTDFLLAPESGDDAQPGYHIFSSTAYYPSALAGQTQAYKFVVDQAATPSDAILGWESSADRTFTIPEQDTTLHWVYFSNSDPVSGVDPVESLVIFNVDLSPFESIGLFDQARGDTLWVFGGFNAWGDCPDINPDNCLMSKVPGEGRFEAAVPITQIPGTNVVYKYFLDFNDETFMDAFGVAPPSGWEEGHATGTNRFEEFAGQLEQDLGPQFFNDVTPANIIPEGTTITVNFEVDMTQGFDFAAEPFEPAAGDSVSITVFDPIWAFTQGVFDNPRGDSEFPVFIERVVLEDDDGDNIYTGSMEVSGPTYDALTFKFIYGQGTTFVEEEGTDTNTPGRNRVIYLDKNPDGSYAAENTITATFDLEPGPLPFETNPAFTTGIEVVDGELPSQISLGANYPNPFNPVTSFQYSIPNTERVRVRVFDVMGRVVATLVDGVQQAATYEVSFDASSLASGVYIYQLETSSRVVAKKMLLLK